MIECAANVAKALCDSGHPAGLSFIAPECNSFGLALMGARPLSEAFAMTEERRSRNADHPGERSLPPIFQRSLVDGFLESATQVVVLDHLANETTAKADLLLPAGTFAESDGTLVSNEGRAQRFFPVFAPNPEAEMLAMRESWRWLGDPAWSSLDDVLAAIAKELPAAGSRSQGRAPLKVPHGRCEDSARAPSLQRAHLHHRQYQRRRAQAAR